MSRYQQSRFARRRFLGGAAASAATLGLASLGVSCGGDDDDGAGKNANQESLPAAPTPKSVAKPGGTAHLIYSGTGLLHLDLHRTIAPLLTQVASLTTNRLLRHKTDPSVKPTEYEIVPDLAEKWEQPDDLTISLKLRPNVKWQNLDPVNGRLLTANDVIRSFDRQRTNKPEFIHRYLFDWIDSITAPDPTTLVIKAKQPTFRGLGTLALRELPILSADAAEKFGNLEKPEAWAGVGPYILKEFKAGVGFKFERNPDYWEGGGLPYIDAIELQDIPDASAQLSAFLAGSIDQIEAVEPELVSTIKSGRPDARVYSFSAVGGNHFAWTVKGDSPFKDPRVRKAWSLITDRAAMIDSLAGGKPETRVSPVSPGFTTYARSQADIKADAVFNLTEAKALLDAAGLGGGFKTVLQGRAGVASINSWVEWAVQQGKKAGIEIVPETAESAVYLGAQTSHNFKYGQLYSIRAYDDPDEYLYPLFYTGASKNYFETSDAELDRLILKQRGTLKLEERKAVLQEIDRRWTTDFNYHTFGYTLFRNDAIANRLQNHQVRVVTEYSQLRYAWIDD